MTVIVLPTFFLNTMVFSAESLSGSGNSCECFSLNNDKFYPKAATPLI